MALKSILVHVDREAPAARRIDAAIAVAAAQGAHLTGLYVTDRPHLPGYVAAELPADLIATWERTVVDGRAQARALFEERTRLAGISAEWREAEGDPLLVVGLHARYCDLTVIGQVDPDRVPAGGASELPERLPLEVGRPILIVPYAGKFQTIGQHVVVAWNASRESTRAVADAAAFLERARRVTVLCVNPEGGMSGHGDVPGADIAHTLARAGVKAEATHIKSDEVSIADLLLSRIADLGADLLVMGAYGHSRISEMILGGVTRKILAEMTVPTLMSH
jgi:nucleotide-binding universal stress UspA family protein